MVREITTVSEVDTFCQANIYAILQRNTRWVHSNYGDCELKKELFLSATVYAGAASEANFRKKMSKSKTASWSRNFDNAIHNWLNQKYPERVHFSEVEQLIYQKSVATKLLRTGGEVSATEAVSNCDENKALFVECGDICSSGKFCQNKETQTDEIFDWREKMKVQFINSIIGVGIVAKKNLLPDEFLGVAAGEALDVKQFENRRHDPRLNGYIFGVSCKDGTIIRAIDPMRFGNHGRFFNHSCQPNCCFEVWTVNCYPVIKFRVLKEVIEAVSFH